MKRNLSNDNKCNRYLSLQKKILSLQNKVSALQMTQEEVKECLDNKKRHLVPVTFKAHELEQNNSRYKDVIEFLCGLRNMEVPGEEKTYTDVTLIPDIHQYFGMQKVDCTTMSTSEKGEQLSLSQTLFRLTEIYRCDSRRRRKDNGLALLPEIFWERFLSFMRVTTPSYKRIAYTPGSHEAFDIALSEAFQKASDNKIPWPTISVQSRYPTAFNKALEKQKELLRQKNKINTS